MATGEKPAGRGAVTDWRAEETAGAIARPAATSGPKILVTFPC